MAGFKRGGARGGFKKSFTNKRSSPDEDDSTPRASKKAKSDEDDDSIPVIPELKTDDNGDPFVSIANSSGKRRVTVSDFNKNTFVSIREYYVTDAGETKPGKKGISLTIDQYNALLAAAPLIESALAKKDIQVVRPDYDGDATANPETKKESKEEESDAEAEASKDPGEGEEDEE